MSAPFDPHPPRLVVDAGGYVWRDYGEYYSMCPVTDGNGPMREPLTVYEPSEQLGRLREALQFSPCTCADHKCARCSVLSEVLA